MEETEKIIEQMKSNNICKINGKGTGFFVKIPYKSKLLPVLITANSVVNQNDIQNNKIILLYFNNDKKIKRIQLDNNRLIYSNEKLNITIIEIKENQDNLNNNYFELDDSIINYLELTKRQGLFYLNNIYNNNSIYLLNYPNNKDIFVSYGKILYINNTDLIHNCNTLDGSLEAPILLTNNGKLIGIHFSSSRQYNKGKLLIYSIIEFSNIKNDQLLINKEGKNINHKEMINCIIGEFNIKKNKENIRIINSYEQFIRENKKIEYQKENENEKEIKENCEIRINGKSIPFTYFHNFNEEGKFIIIYIFKKNIIKTNYMFYKCTSLTSINLSYFNSNNTISLSSMFFKCSSLNSIDLSNFNTNNVTDMSYIFLGCSSLTNINLSEFNTNKVTNMRSMFNGCSSLTNINLYNFNTNNVTDLSYMFNECSLLTNINLSNFNTYNVIDMGSLFNGCSSLTNINLSNFNTDNAINMRSMFNGCSSLKTITLSNFKTNNVNDMSDMFNGCTLLKNINLSNFKTNKVTEMYGMFNGCSSLTNLNLSNFNTDNVTDMRCMFKGCSSLTNINLSNFNINKDTDMENMFLGCVKLFKRNIITKERKILSKFKFV